VAFCRWLRLTTRLSQTLRRSLAVVIRSFSLATFRAIDEVSRAEVLCRSRDRNAGDLAADPRRQGPSFGSSAAPASRHHLPWADLLGLSDLPSNGLDRQVPPKNPPVWRGSVLLDGMLVSSQLGPPTHRPP
jgi:hypothetical protein